MIILHLPWPPSLNHYYRHVGARVLISRAGRHYREQVVQRFRDTSRQRLRGRLDVGILAFPPDRRRRDLDNAQKAMLDALQHAGLYADDSQIDHLEITRCEHIPHGHLVVTISEADGPFSSKVVMP